MEWQQVIIYALLILFFFGIIAKVTGQTLTEFLSSLAEWMRGTGEDASERAVEI